MGSQFLYPRNSNLLRAAINFSSDGDNTIIPASINNRILIHRMWFVVGAATNLTLKDNLPSPAAVPMAANGALVFDLSGEPWFVTDKNTAFIINSSVVVQCSGEVYYSIAI